MGEHEVKDLGCMNGWKIPPDEYKDCVDSNHDVSTKKLGNCWYEYTCKVCGIRYNIDSSD